MINDFNFEKTVNDELSLPLAIQIEITEECNFRCPFCYNNSGISTQRDFPIEKWKSFLYELRDLGGVFQCGFSGGEPLLYKEELLELMQIVHEDHAGLVLLTNGYYLDKTYVDKLCQYNWYWIQVSLDSYRPDIHDKIRGKRGSFNKAIEALRLLKCAGLPAAISTVICKDNIDDIDGICRIAYTLGIDLVMFSPVLPVGRAFKNKYLELDYSLQKKLDVSVEKAAKKFSDRVLVKSAQPYKEQIQNISTVPPYGVLIRPNGDVKTDCLSHHIVGNVFDTPINIIWRRILKDERWRIYE